MIGIVKGMAFKRRNIFFLAELEQINSCHEHL